MIKLTFLLVLSATCLSLQLVAGFPYENTLNVIEKDDNNLNGSPPSEEINSDELYFRTLLRPVIFKTLDLMQAHTNTLIQEEGQFLANLLAEFEALPDKTAYIEELIPQLRSILARRNKLDLHDLSAPAVYEKAVILSGIVKLFADFERKAQSDDNSSETVLLKEVIHNLDLDGLNERIGKSLKEAIQKFTVIYEQFWNSLGEDEKKEHPVLSEWYTSFLAKESEQEKLKSFIDFISILQGIVFNNVN
ncbi:uncharacterized protein LOC118735844 [Rhagoletis pomonella]|uniref:uncharacterized protein LOC118735844 n=1 Tax=Rhagoletis pomonella TaxID=28610 RepID=UPI00177F9BF7|nr:uncharacterized protein LOC118735844 [Rhagoletis pomonella]